MNIMEHASYWIPKLPLRKFVFNHSEQSPASISTFMLHYINSTFLMAIFYLKMFFTFYRKQLYYTIFFKLQNKKTMNDLLLFIYFSE